MKIEMQTSEKTKTSKRPLDYSSTSVRLRLASLVAALGIVILAMQEAGKPETWERIGFGSARPPAAETVTTEKRVSNSNGDQIARPANAKSEPESDLVVLQSLDAREIERLSILIDEISEGAKNRKPGKEHAESISLIEKLKRESGALPSSELSHTVTALRQWLMEPKTDLSSKPKLDRLRSITLARALEFVEDRTSMNRSVERTAWNEVWKSMLRGQESEKTLEVSYIQLSGQPSFYRGKIVQVRGQIRGVEKINLPNDHKLGLDAYYVLWVKPIDSSRTPYCVYSSKLPDGMNDPGNDFVEAKLDAAIEGYFFKLRTYEATNNQVEICPLLVSDSVVTTPPPSSLASVDTDWNPPTWVLASFFIGMPFIAAAMAYGVYKSTSKNRRVEYHNAERTNQSLARLANQPDIKSDHEKIKELYDSES